MSHGQSHTIVALDNDMSHEIVCRKIIVICILNKSLSDYNCQIWMNETQYTTPCGKLILWLEFAEMSEITTWYMLWARHHLFFNTTNVNTWILQVFGVDSLPLLIKTFEYKLEDCPSQTKFLCCMTGTIQVSLIPLWSTKQNYHNRNVKVGLHLIYAQLLQVNIGNFLVQYQLPNWYIHDWSDCSITTHCYG